MKRIVSIVFLILGLGSLLGANGLVLRDLVDIRQADPLPPPGAARPAGPAGQQVIRIGVISRYAPNIIYAGYQPLIDYLNRHGTFAYELRLSTSYQDAVDRLRNREVTASFLGAWITGNLESEPDLAPLLAPVNEQGASEFHAVLVTGPDSGINSLRQLAGRRVALPSPDSWSGNWLTESGLPSVGLTAADLDTLHHFDHHQTVVWQVLRGQFDAGVVKEAVARRYYSEGLRPVARSAAIPGPPLVGNRNAPEAALREITRLLLELDPADPADRAVLAGWTADFAHGFTRADKTPYHREPGRRRENP